MLTFVEINKIWKDSEKYKIIFPPFQTDLDEERVDSMIEAYEERYENLHALMTGGDANYFKPFLRKKITEDPDLIFKGLYVISGYNLSI